MTIKQVEKIWKDYLSRIGSTGGKKSKRKLSKKEARRIALLRWGKKK